MSEALFAVPFSLAVFLPLRYQHILADLLKAGKAHTHIAIMHEVRS
jgi:hypothetical protein